MEENEENKSGKMEDEKISAPLEKKIDLVGRNLLRLYKYLADNKEFNEDELMAKIDVGTPNEKLRNKIDSLKIDLEALEEENQALRQMSLQSQIQHEEQIEMYELEQADLKRELKELRIKFKNTIEQMEQEVKDELKKRSRKYKEIIKDLRDRLKEASGKGEKLDDFMKGFDSLQNKMLILIKDNENLERTLKKNQRDYETLLQDHETFIKEYNALETKFAELNKKVELQQNVINGYKRKYGII